ncbi:MAG TPA: preprotein translocase subunit SecG [Thermoanaerobaculia bacterium]
MSFLVYFIHVLVCVFLILVVLLQQGKGADLSVFGGGSTQTAFGARGATTLLHKLTVGSFIIFTVTTISIGLLGSRTGGGSVVHGIPKKSAPAAQTQPAQKVPVPVAPAAPAPANPAPPSR